MGKLSNREVTPQAICPIVSSLMKMDGAKASTAIQGSSGLNFLPIDRANAIEECFENVFTPHELCDQHHKRWVEACVQALLQPEDNTPSERVKPCDVQKLIHSLKLRKTRVIDGIPNECLRYLPRRPLVYLAHLINHCFRLFYFPLPWNEAKEIALLKRGENPKFPKNLRPIRLLSTTVKLFGEIIKKIVRKRFIISNLINVSQFGFRARHSMTLQRMRLTDHVIIHFNSNICTATAFLDIEKAFDTIWRPSFLYKL
jgi:hypothetical protein